MTVFELLIWQEVQTKQVSTVQSRTKAYLFMLIAAISSDTILIYTISSHFPVASERAIGAVQCQFDFLLH